MTYSPFRHIDSIIWKERPIQLTLFLTRKCNARCSFCFYLSRDQEPQAPELTFDEIRGVSASLDRLLWLAFSGGEPFLRQDLVEIASVFYQQNKPSIILLPTNGLLPDVIRETTEAILKQCPRSTIVVKLSLDGPEEIHDALRGVPGAHRRTLETCEKLRPLLARYKNFELGVNTVLCAANQESMDGIISFVRGLEGIRTHTVSLIRGEVAERGLKQVDLEMYQRTSKTLERNLKEKQSQHYRFRGARLKAAQDILQRQLIHQTALERKRLIPCFAGRLNLVITETGDVYPCESFDRLMGNVRTSAYDVKNLLRTEQARGAIRSITNGNCWCTHECYMMTNILFNPAQYPSLLREYIKV